MGASRIFLDTSAIYAFLVAEDRGHPAAVRELRSLQRGRANFVSSSYVIQETLALLQARVGMDAVRRFSSGVFPILDVVWIERELYDRALTALLAANSRQVSLTDWTSFEVMRSRGIDVAFAFDPHFGRQGFRVLPATTDP
jgi:predicted nucleic acid-binding protein